MAKRMIDTGMWSDPFFRSLSDTHKLLWIFLFTNCDHAGIWQVDWDLARLRIPLLGSADDALEAFGDRVLPIKNGEKWFIVPFIPFQYGVLKENNRVHRSVFKIFEDNGVMYDKEGVTIPLRSPYLGAKDKDKDKDKEGVQGEKTKRPILFRDSEFFDFERFRGALGDWPEEKCRDYWQQALDWSDGASAKGGREQKKIDWIRTVKVWARNDNGSNGKHGGEENTPLKSVDELIAAGVPGRLGYGLPH